MRYEITQGQIFHFRTHKIILFEESFENPQKLARNRELGHILFQLTEVRPIRFLFERPAQNETIDLSKSSFQGIIAGVLITPATLTVFAPDYPIAVTERATLLVYGECNSLFTCRREDPMDTILKSQGYNYGDRLDSDAYPLIYR